MAQEQPPAMQNVWTVTVELGTRSLDDAMTELADRINKKQDECHDLGMLATIDSISHDVTNLYGKGNFISAVMTVTITPLGVTTVGGSDHLIESLSES